MIALSFENIIVFIFYFPASSPALDKEWGNSLVELKISDKGIFVKNFLSFSMANGHFDPIDLGVRNFTWFLIQQTRREAGKNPEPGVADW